MRGLVAWLALSVVLAGCSDGKDKTSDGQADVEDPVADMNGTLEEGNLTDPLGGNATSMGMPFDLDASDCLELIGIFSVPLGNAQQFVPDSYTILADTSGRATVISGLKECGDVQIDGSPIGPASTVDVGVLVDKGEPGVFHYYQTWWYTDNAILHGRLVELGWETGLSNDTLIGAPGTPGPASAEILGPLNEYEMAGLLGPAAPGGTNEAVGWYDGPIGTVTITKTLAGTSMAVGQLTLTGGGAAAELIGNETPGAALWNEYGMTGRVDFAA